MAKAQSNVYASPHAEQATLGGLLLDAHAWSSVASTLAENDFTRIEHRLIYRAIAGLAETGSAVDILTVQNWLSERHQLGNAGGLSYIASLVNDTPSAANITVYAEIVRRHSDRRRKLEELEAERQKILDGEPGMQTESARLPIFRRLSEVQARPIKWLWQGRIARGKVSMIAGHPGRGKSQITASMAAIVTTGGRWPLDGVDCEQGAVVFLSAEDSAADTIKPRLDAAGADTRHAYVLDAVRDVSEKGEGRDRTFNLARDLSSLRALLVRLGNVKMVVIDPVTAYLGDTDSHKNSGAYPEFCV